MTAESPDEQSLEDRAAALARNGWGPLPIPTGKKKSPPEGMSGAKSPELPSYADWYTHYCEDPDRWGNLAARIPKGAVGVDVDAYRGKRGGETWKILGGPDWPETVLVSARFIAGYDGVSAIRLYRLPEEIDQADLWGAHDGIEILRFNHRYAMAPGSWNPDIEAVYRVFDQRTKTFLDTLPPVEELPVLSVEQARLLTPAGAPWGSRSDAATERAADPNPMCRYTTTLLARYVSSLATSDSRFDQMRDGVWALVRAEDEGHHLGPALDTLKLAYVAQTAKDRRDSGGENPVSEFDRALRTAVEKVAAAPTDEMFKACCAADDGDLTPPELGDVVPEDEEFDGDEVTLSAYDQAVRRKYAELRLLDDARGLLADFKAGEAMPLEPIRFPDFITQPDEEENYRVEGLWPAEGRAMLSAAAKSGKTTMVAANLIPSLLDGRTFLGRFAVQPVTGSIVYLNMEVGPRTLRRWMKAAGVPVDERLVVLNLRGKASSLALGSDKGRERFSAALMEMGAEVVILDPLAPLLASLGLDENSNAEVARFFSWWAEALDSAGVCDDLIVHHTGHAGQRSRGASRFNDEPDAIWTLTKSEEEDEDELDTLFGSGPTRYLSAYGRDVDLAAEGLEYDPQTHALTLNGQAKGKENVKKIERRIIKTMSDGVARTRNAICKELGGSRGNTWEAIDRLIASGELVDSGHKTSNKYPLLILGTA